MKNSSLTLGFASIAYPEKNKHQKIFVNQSIIIIQIHSYILEETVGTWN